MISLRLRDPLRRCVAAAFVLGAALVACRGDTKQAGTVGRQARAAAVRAAPADTPAVVPAGAPDSMADAGAVTIRALTGGDRACYVDLDSAGVTRSGQEASFTLCERKDLVGKRVHLARKQMWVLAASCQGDPECARRDTVNLIVSARVVPSAEPR